MVIYCHFRLNDIVYPGNTNSGGRLSTIDLLIKVGCFVKKVNDIFNKKGADLN